MNQRIDLHTHSNCSDGVLAPSALVALAAQRQVDLLALTGDTVDNVPGVDKVGPKTAMNWAAGIWRHWREKNALRANRLAAWRGANTDSGHRRLTQGRAGQGLPLGPWIPES